MRPFRFAAIAFLFITPASVFAEEGALISPLATARPVIATHGMIVSQEAAASRVGLDILKRGGNAVDAAVAVGFALAVTLPRAGNLGGGGFMLIYRADLNRTIAIDYRETAPARRPRMCSSTPTAKPILSSPGIRAWRSAYRERSPALNSPGANTVRANSLLPS